MDISFCDSKKGDKVCPKREDCIRYVESLNDKKWSVHQSFLLEAPFIQKMDEISCEEFWSINNK
jgi:hypothetical protein